MVITTRNSTVELSSGSRTSRMISHLLAPSMRAASTSEGLILALAAERMSVEKPISFQPVMTITVQMAILGSERNLTGSRPMPLSI